MKRLSIAAVVLLALFACKKNEPAATETAATATTSTQAADTAATASDTNAPATASAATSSNDVCAYLSVAEASEAAGIPMERDANVSSDCQYIAVDKDKPWTISAKVEDGTVMYDMQSDMQGAEKIPGLGDKAVWNPTFHQMAVVKGNREIFLGGAGLKKEAYVAAAQKILPKI